MLRISFDGDDRGIFLGLKFSTLVFFWFGKFWFTRRFFCVFKTIWRCHCAWCYWWNRRCSWVSRVLMARRLSLIFCMGFFRRGGLIFLRGFFVKPNGFYSGGRVDFCPHSNIPVTWNPEYPVPWELGATEDPAVPSPFPLGLLRGICPPRQSRGWSICKSCAARGPGICQPRGQARAFDTHTVYYQNITTQRILLEK